MDGIGNERFEADAFLFQAVEFCLKKPLKRAEGDFASVIEF